MHILYLIIDMSKSMSQERLFQSLKETVQKIQQSVITPETNFSGLVAICSGGDKNKIVQAMLNPDDFKSVHNSDNGFEYKNPMEFNWLPKEKDDCKGVAPIVDCLVDLVKPTLQSITAVAKSIKGVKIKNSIIVISDGYWCGSHEKLQSFEVYYSGEKNISLVEININNNGVFNLSKSNQNYMGLNGTDENMTKKIVSLLVG